MTTKSKFVGYNVIYKNNQWVYADTLKPITIENEAYVQFLDGNSISGKDALVILDILKKHKKE